MEEKSSENSAEAQKPEKRLRGQGSGSSFFALSLETLETLWRVETSNRLQLVLCYLVLAAGTGADHRLTKWSARACEEHVGIGTPRAKRAIDELIKAGVIEVTETATKLSPQYRLPEIPRTSDPIFLPVQIVTGLNGETSVLRRVRETGDPLLLRMLLDLYGMIQLDATHGVPIHNVRASGSAPKRAFEIGVHSVWALKQSASPTNAFGPWLAVHKTKAKVETEAWQEFWDRLAVLRKMGAVWFEQWVFDGVDADAEPLFPVDFGFQYEAAERDDTTDLSEIVFETTAALAGERSYLLEQTDADMLVPLPAHQRPPTLVGVLRLRVEADTPGRRRAFAKRNTQIERYARAYQQLAKNAVAGRFDVPLGRDAYSEAS